MFTGIIEEIGKVTKVIKKAKGILLNIEATRVMKEMEIGDSIAVDGVCLTIVKKGATYFQVEVGEATLRSTTFMGLKTGKAVNLERPLTLSTRLGGHIITGHVDGKGKIIEKEAGKEFNIKISYPPSFSHYLIKKGSIAVDGISLTVQEVEKSFFQTYVIPHTSATTTLSNKKVGDEVNLEFDFLIKIFHKWWEERNTKTDFHTLLAQAGFLST
ncbi:MAG: riboflavin synthase [Caldiserica bacterium]|nr:riboflavin synthase [Caldisericota bacterium]